MVRGPAAVMEEPAPADRPIVLAPFMVRIAGPLSEIPPWLVAETPIAFWPEELMVRVLRH